MSVRLLIEYIGSCYHAIPIGISVGLLVVFCVGTILLLTFLGFKKGIKWSVGLLLLEYIFLLISLSVLFRPVQGARTFEMVPFWSYRSVCDGSQNVLTQIIANVLAFIPIGLLLGISFPNIKWWKVLLIGGAFSLLIETLQFFFRRGFAEFDDVWHNVLGCLLGYGFFVGFACLIKKQSKSDQLQMKQR